MARTGNDTKRLTTLVDVSQTLFATRNLKAALHRVLEILERDHGMVRSVVTMLNDGSGELRIEAAHGLTPEAWRKRCQPGDGVIGRVLRSGKPVVIPRDGRLPFDARNRALDKQGSAFVCAPIIVNRRPVGALAADLPLRRDHDYSPSVKFLRKMAFMIAQAVKVHRLLATEHQRLVEENIHLKEELRERYDFSNIIGNSGAMRRVYEQLAKVAPTATTVLIRGESGTGKDLIARAIHYNSPRAKKPLVRVSCAALPETLIESELFGYEKGAFTGAFERKKGRLEVADGGTLFLDEIGELNPSTQVKLLRVLQEKEFEPLGSTETVKLDARLIAATNKDLEKAMADGAFREDLYYRLNVFAIFVPPLRERKPDVMLLADHFLEKYVREHGKNIRHISTPAIDLLMGYHWPGNVRELENAIEHAVLVCESNSVQSQHLPPALQTAEASESVTKVSLADRVASYEKELIQDVLKTTGGNCARAAKLLNTTERILGYRIKKYAINCDRLRR
jgi:Nif-specific regulatory protein